MNYRSMTFEELVREAAHSDDLLALELVKRIDELGTELSEAREECERLENEIDIRPLCEDEDHIDFDVLLDFFNDVVEWVGINDAWLEKRETAKLALEAIQEAMPID